MLKSNPHGGLVARTSDHGRKTSNIPFRIDLAGGWLDQPFVSKVCPGPVLTVSVEPTMEFERRSGMATSTRNRAIEIWGQDVPTGQERETLARLLFCYDNPPETEEVSGSQDAIGIVYPGLACSWYQGGYFPSKIDSYTDTNLLTWIQDHIRLIRIGPRRDGYRALEGGVVSFGAAKSLASASAKCLQGILARDLERFGSSVRESFEAQVEMFPRMVEGCQDTINAYKSARGVVGWKLTGAGGGGYLVIVGDEEVEGSLTVEIRQERPEQR
ncbi:MAG: hypothetical protein BWX88_05071 [Planctomycetes bacterium ADurb.Bin126]|nr:MAG: hypothetical protein BWX88_05071 [Planctomycetes bacterium ADurb.Bin126]